MAGVREELGISIVIDDRDLKAGLGRIQNTLKETFSVEAITKLVKQMAELDKVNKQAESGFKATKKEVENFAEAFTDGNLTKAKEEMEKLYDTKKLKQWSKEATSAWAEQQKQQEAGIAAARKATEASIKETERMRAAKLKALNEDKAALDAYYAHEAKLQMAAYNRMGAKPVNGGWVNSTVNTKVSSTPDASGNFSAGFTKLTQEALELNAALSKVKSTNPFADIFKGLPAATTTLSELQTKLNAVYGDLTKLDGKSLTNINGQLKNYNATLQGSTVVAKEANAWTKIFGDSLGRMAARLAEFYSIRTLLFGISGQFRSSVTTLLDLNQALHDTLAITGASPKNFKDMEQAALNMAKNTKFSATEVAEAMKTLAQAGVSGNDLLPVTRVATMLATGTGATIEQASKVLTTGMNVWKIEAKDSIDIANVLTGALNASKLEIGELGTAFNYLANQSALTGRSLTETAALIATLRNQGIAASTIGTSMSQMMKTLEAPTPKFKNLLDKYKIKPEDIAPTKHSMVEIVKVFEDAAKKMGNNSIGIGDIFKGLETRVGRGFATLVQAGSESLKQMEEQIKNTNSAAVAWAESMKGARSQLNILKAELTDTISAYSKNFSAMVGAKDVLREFIVGMRDTGVQAVVLTTALGGLLFALRALSAHPVMFAFTLIGAGIAAIAQQVGKSNRAIATEFDNLNNSVASSARDFKNATEELMGLNRELALNKRDSAGNVKVSGEYASILNTVLSKYPELQGNLKDERKLQAAVTAELKKQNDERRETAKLEASKYGVSAGKANQQVKDFRADFKKYYGKELPQGASLSVMEEILKETQKNESMWNWRPGVNLKMKNSLSALKESVPALNNSAGIIKGNIGYVPSTDQETGLTTGFTFNPNLQSAVNKVIKNTDKNLTTGGDKTGSATAEKYKPAELTNILRELKNSTSKVIADTQLKVLEDSIKQTEDNMKFASDSAAKTEYEQENSKLTEQLAEWVKLKRKEVYDDLWASVVGKAKGTFIAGKGVADTGTYKFDDERDRVNFKGAIDSYALEIKNQIEGKFPSFTSKAGLMGGKRPEYAPVEDKQPNGPLLDATRLEKQLAFELQAKRQSLELRKEEAYSAEEIANIDKEILDATIDINHRKVELLETDNRRINQWVDSTKLTKENSAEFDRLAKIHDQNIESIKTENLLIEEQTAKQARMNKLMSDSGRFQEGFRKSFLTNTDTGSASEEFGKKLTDSMFSGLGDSLNSALPTFTFPDNSAIASIRQQIATLNTQKASIQNDITALSANTTKTPVEAQALTNQKIQLEEVNKKLREQEGLLDRQKNAWTRFADGLKNTMQQILKELQAYIVKLLVVAAVKKLAGLAVNAATSVVGDGGSLFGGGESTIGTKDFMGPVAYRGAADGGFIQKLADGGSVLNGIPGGAIPTSIGIAGKDSVPILGMPGEFMIRKSSVDFYGRDFFEKANAQRLAEGGITGAASGLSKAVGKDTSGGKQEFSLVINNIADASQIPPKPANAQEIVNIVSYELSKKGGFSKAVKMAVSN